MQRLTNGVVVVLVSDQTATRLMSNGSEWKLAVKPRPALRNTRTRKK